VLSIHNDGKGFDPAVSRQKGLGLSSMTYRAQLIGGTLAIGPGKRGGTVVTCHAPDSVLDMNSK
jgi:signal transduction histidine kinase